MSALAHDLAVQLYSIADVLKAHSLTRVQYDHLLTVPVFNQILTQASENWTKPTSVKQRVALQAQLLVEKALPSVGARVQSDKEDLPAVIEGLKLAAKLGGIGETTQQQGPQERFVINIDFGGEKLVFDKTRPTVTLDAEATESVEVEPQSRAPAGRRTLPALAEGPRTDAPAEQQSAGPERPPELQHKPKGA